MLKLYHGITSVCSVKVRLGLAEMGLKYESVVLDLKAGDQHHPDYLTLNRDGVVPTLIDDGHVLVESNLILEHLDRVHNGSALMPSEPFGQTRARHWLYRCLALHDAINTLTFSTVNRHKALATRTPEQIRASVEKIPNPAMRMKRQDIYDHGLQSGHVKQALVTLKRALADMSGILQSRDSITEPEFGIADVAVLSYIDRLERLGLEGLWDNAPEVAAWLSRMQARPSYKAELLDKVSPEAAAQMRQTGSTFWPEIEAMWRAET